MGHLDIHISHILIKIDDRSSFSEVGPWDERGVTTYYCNTKLCNTGASMMASAILTIVTITLSQFFRE